MAPRASAVIVNMQRAVRAGQHLGFAGGLFPVGEGAATATTSCWSTLRHAQEVVDLTVRAFDKGTNTDARHDPGDGVLGR